MAEAISLKGSSHRDLVGSFGSIPAAGNTSNGPDQSPK